MLPLLSNFLPFDNAATCLSSSLFLACGRQKHLKWKMLEISGHVEEYYLLKAVLSTYTTRFHWNPKTRWKSWYIKVHLFNAAYGEGKF